MCRYKRSLQLFFFISTLIVAGLLTACLHLPTPQTSASMDALVAAEVRKMVYMGTLTPAAINATLAPSPTMMPVAAPGGLVEAYCLWEGDILYHIADYAQVGFADLLALNPDASLMAGSVIHLPPGSLPPSQWANPMPIVNSIQDLPFGESGYYIGKNNRIKQVALTFDIGFTEDNPRLIELLDRYGAKATFFMLGVSVPNHPELIQQIVNSGHELGNHSWSHGYPTSWTEQELIDELGLTEIAVSQAVAGASTRPWFRAPFGEVTPQIRQVAAEQGYHAVGWTVDSQDWMDDMTADRIYEQVTENICPGAIVVMHDANPRNLEAMQRILEYLTANGYEMVTLSELLLP